MLFHKKTSNIQIFKNSNIEGGDLILIKQFGNAKKSFALEQNTPIQMTFLLFRERGLWLVTIIHLHSKLTIKKFLF